MLKDIGNILVNCIPSAVARITLTRAATLLPAVKTMFFERVCAKIARTRLDDQNQLIRTNLGISSDLRCDIPLKKAGYAFGRPENNLSERSTLVMARQLSKDCSHFIDVGAHEGIFTFSIAKSGTNLSLHCFEPDSALFKRLAANLASNHIVANVNQTAVSNEVGWGTFYKNLSDDLSGSLMEVLNGKHETRREQVSTVTLEAYFRANGIENALVKVDVEGTANDLWSGAARVSGEIKYMIIEILEPEIHSGLPARIISETGWYAYYIKDFDLIPSRDGSFNYHEPFWNWLFCRLPPPSLAQRLAGTPFRLPSS